MMPSEKKFGWSFALIFIISFIYFLLTNSILFASLCLSIAIIFALTTIFIHSALEPLNKAWFSMGLFLSKYMSPIVLSVIFFIIIVPVAIVTRLLGRDALFLRRRQVSSYWINKDPIDPKSFKNQF